MKHAIRNHEHQVPTLAATVVFRAKVWGLQLQRGWVNLFSGVKRHGLESEAGEFQTVLVDSRTPLWTDDRPEEQWYQLGKVENLRRAVRQLDGCLIPAGSTFSFWKQIGRASRTGGYVEGRMLQQGCVMPAVGGGLCQLSNALYDLALRSHCDVVERHPHSRLVQDALIGRDATVAWNYVDLRFRPKFDLRISSRLSGVELALAFEARSAVASSTLPVLHTPRDKHYDETCASCGETSCSHHEGKAKERSTRQAFLLDGYTPEFNAYLKEAWRPEDSLAIPMDGRRWRRPRYAWTADGFGKVHTATMSTLLRAFRSRRLGAQGAARQRAMLESSQRLARELERILSFEITHVTVSQTLLPFLWMSGVLGGRTFDVLADRLPMFELQRVLNDAFKVHPESTTLGDFRGPTGIVEAERMALEEAREIVTAHGAVAALFPAKMKLLAWRMADAGVGGDAKRRMIVFPGPTVGRKGAYELRAALEGIGADLWVVGSELEGDDFWRGFNVRRGPDWMEHASVVVQPAYVENQPRALLRALAAGIPVIATEACGLPAQPLLTIVPAGDVAALRGAMVMVLGVAANAHEAMAIR
jgi:hypothetical protein